MLDLLHSVQQLLLIEVIPEVSLPVLVQDARIPGAYNINAAKKCTVSIQVPFHTLQLSLPNPRVEVEPQHTCKAQTPLLGPKEAVLRIMENGSAKILSKLLYSSGGRGLV